MKEYLEFETTPFQENCAQVGQPDYYEKSQEEIKKTFEILQQKLIIPNEKFDSIQGYFTKKANEHDFGTYYEIRYNFYDDDTEKFEIDGKTYEVCSWDFANFIENNWPETWEDTKPVSFEDYVKLNCSILETSGN